MSPRIKGSAVLHTKPCPDCLGDGSYEVASTTPDAHEARCERCRGAGHVTAIDCLCVECEALAVIAGLFTEAEVTDEALALLRFWKRNGVSEAEVAL